MLPGISDPEPPWEYFPDHRRRSGNYAVVLPWLHVPPSLTLVATEQEVRVGLPSRFRGPSTGSRKLDGISFVLVLRADPTLSYGHQGWSRTWDGTHGRENSPNLKFKRLS
jgi:hypothetical protein